MNYKIIFFLIVILISVICTVKKGREDNDLKGAVRAIIFGFSTILTLFIMIGCYEKINYITLKILDLISGIGVKYRGALHFIVIIILFIIIKVFIQLILLLIQNLVFGDIIKKLGHKKFFVTIYSFVFGIIRGAIFIVLIFISLILYNNVCDKESKIEIFNDTLVYKRIESLLNKNNIMIAKDTIIENNGITYYNGVTLEEALVSNELIHKKAYEITKDEETEIGKAKAIYIWIGSNITYDNDKAIKIMNNDYSSVESGAVATYRDRKGICFDYAILYSVMCKEIGLKTQIVIGKADNGEEYISHSWNKVYISSEEKWVNVDTVYYKVGAYFSEEEFSKDHKEEKMVMIS